MKASKFSVLSHRGLIPSLVGAALAVASVLAAMPAEAAPKAGRSAGNKPSISQPAATARASPAASPFAGTQWKAAPKAKTPSYYGGSTVRQQFNRRTIGEASGVKPAMRARAYKALDSNQSRGRFNNKEGRLPKVGVQGGKPQYEKLRLKDAPHNRKWSNGRVVVEQAAVSPKAKVAQPDLRPAETRGKGDLMTIQQRSGPAYVSRHYGDNGGKISRRIQ